MADKNLIHRLEQKLRYANQIQDIPGKEEDYSQVWQDICVITFDNDLDLALWDEPILSLLSRLFENRSPGRPKFQERAQDLKERYLSVKKINDMFFAILDSNTDENGLENTLAKILNIGTSPLNLSARLENRLSDIRTSKNRPSGKIEACLAVLQYNLLIDFGDKLANIENCLEAIKDREQIGSVNALVINSQNGKGAVIPLRVVIQDGTGVVNLLTEAQPGFKFAVDRAMASLKKDNLLRPTDGIDLSLDVTNVLYSGDSIALAAAIAMSFGANEVYLDTYTAFSGNINVNDGGYAIQAVEGISKKIDAAIAYGCRRIFLPKGNETDIPQSAEGAIEIITIDHVAEAIAHLQMPSIKPQSGGLNVRKATLVQVLCQQRGWQLSPPEEVQDGHKFTITPPNLDSIKVTIYHTGSHQPKEHQIQELNEFLVELNNLDEMALPVGSINEKFNIQNTKVRRKIQDGLERIGPSERRQELYCDYSLCFEDGKQKLWVKQYTSGKLVIQGSGGDLYKQILEVIIPNYNFMYPQAKLEISEYLKKIGVTTPKPNSKESTETISTETIFPYIGTDESGKGDYFGPLVSAGVYVDTQSAEELAKSGVKDSKQLSDNQNLKLAQEIVRICKGRYTIIEISPEKYNDLYEQFKKEGKNLNTLLAWGHAKALEELLTRVQCKVAIADQFADERFIMGKLQEKGKGITLTQMHKAERNIGVAAASILARARFLEKLSKLSNEYKVTFHKGASDLVVDDARTFVSKYGKETLSKVAKLHFKTTQRVGEKY